MTDEQLSKGLNINIAIRNLTEELKELEIEKEEISNLKDLEFCVIRVYGNRKEGLLKDYTKSIIDKQDEINKLQIEFAAL